MSTGRKVLTAVLVVGGCALMFSGHNSFIWCFALAFALVVFQDE